MTNKGYSNLTAVSLHLGRTNGGVTTLSTDQQTHVTSLIGAAEAYIDRTTRKTWLAPPITAERYDIAGPQIFLRKHPVTSVELVHVRTVQVGDPGRDLVANKDYELIDANLGQLRFANIDADEAATSGPDDIAAAVIGSQEAVFTNAIAFVSYTPVGPPVPADITLAATLIVAQSLYLQLFPDRWGITDASLDAQTKITYAEGAVNLQIPESAQRIIDGYVQPIIA